MRVYFQKQCVIESVSVKDSAAIMKISQEILGISRWEFSRRTLVSEKTTIYADSMNEEKEKRIFQNFVKMVEEQFPDIKKIKLQFYSVHEVPTSCFVMEKKEKHNKSSKLIPTAPVEKPVPWVLDEPDDT